MTRKCTCVLDEDTNSKRKKTRSRGNDNTLAFSTENGIPNLQWKSTPDLFYVPAPIAESSYFFLWLFLFGQNLIQISPPFQLKTKVYLEFPIVSSSVMGLFHILYLGLDCILYLWHFQILYLGPSYIKHSAFIICIFTYFVIFFILPCFVLRAFLKLCSCTFSYLHNALWT